MPPKLELPFAQTPCLMCKEPLCLVDALACHHKRIQPVLRDNVRHGVCELCLETALLIERLIYGGTAVHPADVEKVLGRDLGLITVRCYFCGAPLDDNEKLRHQMDRENLLLIRRHLRGRCYKCYSHGKRPSHV